MNSLKQRLLRYYEAYCRHHNILRLKKTKVGIKFFNVTSFRIPLGLKDYDSIPLEIDPNDLFLDVDYLKDDYSLLNIRIIESPHYHFIKAIREGSDLRNTDYYKRLIAGTLDSRFPQRIKDFSVFIEKCKQREREIINQTYEPVSIYQLGSRFYIRDGKHRAAFCAILNKPVLCRLTKDSGLVSNASYCAFTMMKDDPGFARHMLFYSENGLFSRSK